MQCVEYDYSALGDAWSHSAASRVRRVQSIQRKTTTVHVGGCGVIRTPAECAECRVFDLQQSAYNAESVMKHCFSAFWGTWRQSFAEEV